MVIRILPMQVPSVWEQIKWAATKADRISEKDIPLYLNRLLIALLSDRAQCFLRMSNERELLALAITRIIFDEVTGEKALFVNCLYSFKGVPDTQWADDMALIAKFAKQEDCKKIVTYSANERVFDIVQSIGFTERYRSFVMEI